MKKDERDERERETWLRRKEAVEIVDWKVDFS